MADFQMSIVSKEKVLFEGHVDSLIAPGFDGKLGILAHHCPIVYVLKKGELFWRESGGEGKSKKHVIHGGLLEMAHNRVSLLIY